MYLAAALAHYIAAKMEYRHPRVATYEQYVFENAPERKPKGKKQFKVKAPFSEV